jgi:uncharacterized protein (TIGR02145 family)
MRKIVLIGCLGTAIFFLLVLSFSCKKNSAGDVPILATTPATITGTVITSGGNITSEGSAAVLRRGVCWSIVKNPTNKYKDSITSDGTGIGNYNSIIPGIKTGTTYFVRAYASNGAGTGYGNEVIVVVAATLPVVITAAVVAIRDSLVHSGGTVTKDGGSAVTVRGVCWSTVKNPTTADSFTTDSLGMGSFKSSVAGISPDVTYYLRAYATNSVGTGYGAELSFSTGKSLVKDKDGNYYNFVKIGSQVWLTENLKTARLSDSISIALVENGATWSSQIIPAYCWYNDDVTSYKDRYGALYNWYAVNTGKLCPTGWHVPTDADWTTLSTYLGGDALAGGKLKELGILNWDAPNASATNSSGFTALPGGYRMNTGIYGNVGTYGNWWSTTSVLANVANYRYLYYGNASITKSFISQKSGLSVRCLKN